MLPNRVDDELYTPDVDRLYAAKRLVRETFPAARIEGRHIPGANLYGVSVALCGVEDEDYCLFLLRTGLWDMSDWYPEFSVLHSDRALELCGRVEREKASE